MNASERTGVALAVTATTMVGSMVAASSLIVDYPVLAGQAGRYALGAAVLAAVVQLTGRRRLPRLSPREPGLVVTSVGFVAWYSGVARLGWSGPGCSPA